MGLFDFRKVGKIHDFGNFEGANKPRLKNSKKFKK